MSIELDYMEYATDALAQAAYVTDGYDSDVLTGGTATADSENPTFPATYAVDNNEATRWESTDTALPHWWKYDFGVGVTKIVTKLRVLPEFNTTYQRFKDFVFAGSNNNTDWTNLYTGQHANNCNWEDYIIPNNTAYRYYKITITSTWEGNVYAGVWEIEMMETILQSYSEATIKTQGSYSLKGIAAITESLNKTLTRTIGSPIDLSGQTQIKFDIYAGRTGSNIKIGIHDAVAQLVIDRTLGTPIGDMTAGGGLAAGFDGNTDQGYLQSAGKDAVLTAYIGKDWGAGVTKTVSGFRAYGSNNYGFKLGNDPPNPPITITLQGSTDNFVASIVDLGTATAVDDAAGLLILKLTGINVTTAYRYHRLKIYANYAEYTTCAEAQFYETAGGTTTEKTHSISSANTWETDIWDISAVADADKDAIDKIVITIVNADVTNTFYIDNMFADVLVLGWLAETSQPYKEKIEVIGY